MPSAYALIAPDNLINRIEPASRINPSVPTKAGWRWLPVEDDAEPTVTPLQSVATTDEVQANRVLRRKTAQARSADEQRAVINAERDRRMSVFTFGGKQFQFDDASQLNISGAGTLALAAIINGAQPGNLRWSDAGKDFRWVAMDNTAVTMDAQTTFAFAQAAAKWKADHIHAARTIKDMNPIPTDYADNARWPS